MPVGHSLASMVPSLLLSVHKVAAFKRLKILFTSPNELRLLTSNLLVTLVWLKRAAAVMLRLLTGVRFH